MKKIIIISFLLCAIAAYGAKYSIESSVGQAVSGKQAGKGLEANSGFWYLCQKKTTNGIEDNLPHIFELKQNYPNPFNPSTTISFSLPEANEVAVKIYNIRGELVGRAASGQFKAGFHKVVFDGSNLSSGQYFYQIKAGKHMSVKKMIMVK